MWWQGFTVLLTFMTIIIIIMSWCYGLIILVLSAEKFVYIFTKIGWINLGQTAGKRARSWVRNCDLSFQAFFDRMDTKINLNVFWLFVCGIPSDTVSPRQAERSCCFRIQDNQFSPCYLLFSTHSNHCRLSSIQTDKWFRRGSRLGRILFMHRFE